MEFIDRCITLKVKRLRQNPSTKLFTNSFTEYEVKIIFHSKILLEYRRYSQFCELRKKFPPETKQQLPDFPKKKLINSTKIIEERRQILEKWIQGVQLFPELLALLLEFLNISSVIIMTALSTPVCPYNINEKSIASLIRHSNKIEKNGSKYLKAFERTFFSNSNLCLSSVSVSILLKTIIGFCSIPSVACTSISILDKLIKVESNRQADSFKQILLNSIELLKEIKIEEHILNKYQHPTGKIGFSIAIIVKEHFERNGMSQYFKYFLNFNEEAYEKFCIKVEGAVSCAVRDTILVKKASGEWKWLNTDNYEGGLKVGVRKADESFEVKAEIFVKSSVRRIWKWLTNVDKRKEWDLYMENMKIVKRIDEHRVILAYQLKREKKSSVELLLECKSTENNGQSLATFHSISPIEDSTKINNDSVGCYESYYHIESLKAKIRRSSSTSDDIESDNESVGSCSSYKSLYVIEDSCTSRLVMFFKMRPEMARCFVSDISEETSKIKDSLAKLKRLAEDIKSIGLPF